MILEIEIQGALKIKEQFPETLLLFMVPPSAQVLEDRLRGRGTETEEVVQKRLRRAVEEAEFIEKYDYLIGMEERNRRNMLRILGKDPEKKVSLLLDYADEHGDIADPWYTGNFDITYRDVVRGCEGFLTYLEGKGQIIMN